MTASPNRSTGTRRRLSTEREILRADRRATGSFGPVETVVNRTDGWNRATRGSRRVSRRAPRARSAGRRPATVAGSGRPAAEQDADRGREHRGGAGDVDPDEERGQAVEVLEVADRGLRDEEAEQQPDAPVQQVRRPRAHEHDEQEQHRAEEDHHGGAVHAGHGRDREVQAGRAQRDLGRVPGVARVRARRR